MLHLADVLYNNPKDMLCVKALQRRATAYQVLQASEMTVGVGCCFALCPYNNVPFYLQALDQHGKAVSDLQAAAEILPGDKEVRCSVQDWASGVSGTC